jgi:hypothetical protein
MKPLKGDQQLRSVSLAYSVALQALEPRSLHEEEGAWMQAPIEVSRRGVEKCFLLDILSHRMSAMGIYHQVPKQCTLGILKGEEGSGYELKIVH